MLFKIWALQLKYIRNFTAQELLTLSLHQMEKTAIIYWPKDGNVETVAHKIYSQFKNSDSILRNISELKASDIADFEFLIIGGSTVGAEIWEEAKANNRWNDFFKTLDEISLKDKKIALFGLGDQVLYPNNFVDGLSVIRDEITKRGGKLFGFWPIDDYSFEESTAVEDGKFFGLAIDEDNESELTDERIKNWLEQLKKEMA